MTDKVIFTSIDRPPWMAIKIRHETAEGVIEVKLSEEKAAHVIEEMRKFAKETVPLGELFKILVDRDGEKPLTNLEIDLGGSLTPPPPSA